MQFCYLFLKMTINGLGLSATDTVGTSESTPEQTNANVCQHTNFDNWI